MYPDASDQVEGTEQSEPTASNGDVDRASQERGVELNAVAREAGAKGSRHIEAADRHSKHGHRERIAAGLEFQRVKDNVAHGRFMDAIEAFGVPHRKATLCVSLAERRIFYDGKLASLANFDLDEMGPERLDSTLKQLERDGSAVSTDITTRVPELAALFERISDPEILHYKLSLDPDVLMLLWKRLKALTDNVRETAVGAPEGDDGASVSHDGEADEPPFIDDEDDDQPPFGGVAPND